MHLGSDADAADFAVTTGSIAVTPDDTGVRPRRLVSANPR